MKVTFTLLAFATPSGGAYKVSTQSPRNLARFALHEEINALVLLIQFRIQLLLEVLQGLAIMTLPGYAHRVRLAFGCPNFDQVLDIVVINVV